MNNVTNQLDQRATERCTLDFSHGGVKWEGTNLLSCSSGSRNVDTATGFSEATTSDLEVIAFFVDLFDGLLRDVTFVLTAALVTIAAATFLVVVADFVELLTRTVVSGLAVSALLLCLLFFSGRGRGRGVRGSWGICSLCRRGCLLLLAAVACALSLSHIILRNVTLVNAATLFTVAAFACQVIVADLINLLNGLVGLLFLFTRLALLLGLWDLLAVFIEARIVITVPESASGAKLALLGICPVKARTDGRGLNFGAFAVYSVAFVSELALSCVSKGAADLCGLFCLFCGHG